MRPGLFFFVRATSRCGLKSMDEFPPETTLAAALESSGMTHLATFNGADFAIFPFLSTVTR